MDKQTSYVIAQVSNGAIRNISNTVILQPVIKSNKDGIKWYQDKVRV
nr:hypothetical protein [uncultured Lachnoclostridium sp.]